MKQRCDKWCVVNEKGRNKNVIGGVVWNIIGEEKKRMKNSGETEMTNIVDNDFSFQQRFVGLVLRRRLTGPDVLLLV